MSENNKSAASLGGMEILAIVFVVLKLCGTIDWSWWWVLSPLWIPIALLLAVLVIVVLFLGVGAAIEESVDIYNKAKKG